MEQILVQLVAGFESALTAYNLLFIIIGVVIGIVMGVLPGVGSLTAIPILIPVTFYMEPVTALAFLIAITKGGTSGGAIPAILLNAPGSAENVATARDGYPARRDAESRSRRCGWRCILPSLEIGASDVGSHRARSAVCCDSAAFWADGNHGCSLSGLYAHRGVVGKLAHEGARGGGAWSLPGNDWPRPGRRDPEDDLWGHRPV